MVGPASLAPYEPFTDDAARIPATGRAIFGYVISGSAQLLAGERLLVAGEGDLAVVPSGLIHAFAAAEGSDADLLIVITPGVERFEYFRHLARIATGQQRPESLLEGQVLRHVLRRQPCVAAGTHWPAAGFVTAGDRGSG